ncbi:alpha/beta hydrolase [uncultured Schumannella sp.]|uniref:alpha/beta hydrolase n=1 Tax=uncultured Schumannella sp. TaxID=1195956 RepID=UPI0025FEBDFB|nr:alpha/beta hydrolase [uncultured Schumannella sp.]
MTSPVMRDPALLAWTAKLHDFSRDLPDLRSSDPARRRAAEHILSDLIAVEVTADASEPVATIELEIPTAAGPLFARRYRPLGAGPLPTQLFLHGGGFVAGSAREIVNDRVLRSRAAASGVQFISLEYRLAPEHPYPAAVEDAIAAIDWLRTSPVDLDIDASRLGVGGISAGGGVIASALVRRRAEGRWMPVHQLLEVPAVSLTAVGASAVDYATGFGLEGLENLRDLYVGPVPADPFASPLDLDDLSGMPRTLIMTAEFDPLRDAAEAYATRLREAGCDVSAARGSGHMHGSLALTATFAAALTWQQAVVDELHRHLVTFSESN